MAIEFVTGDLLEQDVDVIVNAWNRNLIPWWLLLPQGISGAIKKRAGFKPFQELRKFGVLPLGGAAVTSAGRLPFKAIIHVAGIGHTWTSSEESVRRSVRSSLEEAIKHDFSSVGYPLIGAGTGGGSPEEVREMIREEIETSEFHGRAVIVTFGKSGREQVDAGSMRIDK